MSTHEARSLHLRYGLSVALPTLSSCRYLHQPKARFPVGRLDPLLAAVRIDLVGTTADFWRFGLRHPLPLNHLPGENRETAGRIGEVGLSLETTLDDAIGVITVWRPRGQLKPIKVWRRKTFD